MTTSPEGRDRTSLYSRRLAARMLDFTSPTTPWVRRLWDVGTFLALEELHEAGEWVDGGVLHAAAVEWPRLAMERVLGSDPAIGSKDVRRQFQAVLKTELTVAGDGRRKLRHLIDAARPRYLDRWAAEVADRTSAGAERVARAVTAHLLDSGHSAAGVHRWLQAGAARLSAADLIEEAAALLAHPLRPWTVTVFFKNLPDFEKQTSALKHWIPAEQAEALLRKAGPADRAAAVVGGMSYTVEARDPERAVELTYDLVERLQARARFMADAGRVVPLAQVLVDGWDTPMLLHPPARKAHVHSLVAEKRLYAVGQKPRRHGRDDRDPLDDALEIASALNGGALAPAVAGGWTALESLLTEARDPDKRGKVVAAERAAALVACSWTRAEMTALSYRVREAKGDDLHARLDACETNRERALLVAERLRERRSMPLVHAWRLESDVAALQRMLEVLDDPRTTLAKVRRHVEISLRRLYRSRNIVLHGGSTGGVALSATLRTSAPLVGAALDRIAHAHLRNGTKPLMLAAQADTALQLVGDEAGRHVCELIE
ncbi:integrase [Spirillospora sp. NPDC029432]|uniref:integrase n=1 Tax=Spirillospora sp. NPDC029432 TaxID=3154599 RepID=UPI003456DA48